MKLKSLANQTNLIFSRFEGEITVRERYIAVKTPTQPSYFWGNYLIMPEAPTEDCLSQWIDLYDQEFDSKKQGFMTFALDVTNGETGAIEQFTQKGFRTYITKVLTTNAVNPPPKLNEEVEIREIKTDDEWDQLVEVHTSASWYLNPKGQIPFLKMKFKALREMCDAGIGKRFGAFLDGKILADLGIYTSGNIGRFNTVATHADYRRRGLCGTLVYKSALKAFCEMGVDLLVMEADEDYHAAGIYESVGFRPTQRQIALEWFDPAIHG